jgi:hypothetical protein
VYTLKQDHERKLATALDYIWKNKKAELRSNKNSFKIFQDLVQILIAQKNTTAIELQSSLLLDP